MMASPSFFRPLPVLGLLLACGWQAQASGFQLREQSPSAQGCSFAGVSAGGSDISGMFFNPAILTRFDGREVVGGASLVKPSARLEDGFAQRAAAFPEATRPISGPVSSGDAGKQGIVPACYALWSLGPDLKLGFSLNSPFGLTSDYADGWKGRYHALKSTMTIVEMAPTVAWRINGQWSAGAALAARHVHAELSNAVDFGAAIGKPGGADGKATVQGSRWGLGYRLGVLFEPTPSFRVGAAYLSAMDFRLKGDVTFEGVPATLAVKYRNGGARPIASQPATASLGAAWVLTDTLTLQGEAARTFWKRFKEIRITFDNGLPDSVTPEQWRDSTFLALGLTWKAAGPWTLRTGVAFDQTPTSDATRTPRIPDGERFWVSAGAGYAFTRAFSMDVACSHLFVQRSTLSLKAGVPGDPDFSRGDLSGSYRNAVDILSVQGRYRF